MTTSGTSPPAASTPAAEPAVAGTEHWSGDEIASFVGHAGHGRVLVVRPGPHVPSRVETELQDAGYRVGRLAVTREPSGLPLAAATFLPDLLYVTLGPPTSPCLDALESLALDPRTGWLPLVALLDDDADPVLIEEAYARSGCDFLRRSASAVELLARTHLLVRLSRGRAQAGLLDDGPPAPEVANDPSAARLDLTCPESGAHTRTYLMHRLPSEISRARRYQRRLTMLAVRCPDAGAQPEQAARLAALLRQRLRTADLVARAEPDLFVVLLPETGLDDAGLLASRVMADCQAVGLSARVGCAGLDDPSCGCHRAEDLLAAAAARTDA